MLTKNLFKKSRNVLETNDETHKMPIAQIPDKMCMICPSCRRTIFTSDLTENKNTCQKCGYHFRIDTRQRLEMITDKDSFVEIDKDLVSENRLNFPGYDKKLKTAMQQSAQNEAVICGTARIQKNPCAVFVMEPNFMMGSMGCIVGEKITRLFEYATVHRLPVLGFTVSGGARMQEGILSLMQMAKTSGAVKRHSDAGLLYIAVLTNPTTGGVTASFAMEADIILAEPQSLIAFAGPRVIEQTIRQKLPAGFQSAEFLLERGFLDGIVGRDTQKELLGKLLSLHCAETI